MGLQQDKRRIGDWDLDEWRAQEPQNCHSHLLSMLLGNTLMLPVTKGELAIGTLFGADVILFSLPSFMCVCLCVVYRSMAIRDDGRTRWTQRKNCRSTSRRLQESMSTGLP